MRGTLAAACIAMTVLAGCSGGTGSSALASVSGPDASARAWADDAVLVEVVGWETDRPDLLYEELRVSREEAEEAGFDYDEVEAINRALSAGDATLGDGNLPAWGFAYISASRNALLVVAVQGGDVVASASVVLPGEAQVPAAVVEQMRERRQFWAVESSDAIAAMRAENAVLDAYLDQAANLTIRYSLDLEGEEWNVHGEAQPGPVLFSAEVDYGTPEVTRLYVHANLGGLTNGGGAPPPPERVLPETIDDTQPVTAGIAGVQGCSFVPVAAECYEYTFTAENEVDYVAALTWGLEVNDFDLFLYDENGSEVNSGANSVPGTSEGFSGTLEAGDYRVVVLPYTSAPDTFHVTVTFS